MGICRTSRVSALLTTAALLAGCGASDAQEATGDRTCLPYSAYQGHRGTTVKIYSPIRSAEADALIKAWEPFEVCTGISLAYEASATFDVAGQVKAGKAPDLAFFFVPGMLTDPARTGLLKPAGAEAAANVTKYFSAEWRRYGSVDGKLYGVPIDAQVKSLVWYSPKFFTAEGYTVPRTWDEMLALSDRIAAGGSKPWCIGIEEGFATGWPVTDWLEDTLLRTAGSGVYDRWSEHEIPFDDPRVAAALDRVGGIVKNPKYVNGGHGGVGSIATTASQEGGLPILQRACAMHRQASFYSARWPPTAKIAEDGDIFAFYLPPVGASAERPVLGGGTFAAALTDRPEAQAVLAYLATPEFANRRAATGDVVSANKEFDRSHLTAPIARLCADLLADPAVTFRFDGSDLMPASVGAGSFWTEMVAWVKGRSTAAALRRIESTWPG
jgi:alpha-glucoside transport system substrate-binding protein